MVTETAPKAGERLMSQPEIQQYVKSVEGNEPQTIYCLLGPEDTDGFDNYGLPSQCLPSILPMKLAEKKADGSPVWSLQDPGVRPESGHIQCLLHPDHPNREIYRAMGLGTCKKENIKNEYECELHMQTKHKREAAVIKSYEEKEEKRKAMELQTRIAEAMAGKVNEPEEAPLYVSDKPKAKRKKRSAKK